MEMLQSKDEAHIRAMNEMENRAGAAHDCSAKRRPRSATRAFTHGEAGSCAYHSSGSCRR